MADLDSPVKSIFVSVFDMIGNQLATTDDQSKVSVVSFRYKYDDEDDDICTVKLQMEDPISLNQLNIERGSKLQIVFGYIGNPLSPVTTVVVRDMTSKYGTNVIYTELECTDYLTYMKTTRSDDVGSGAFIDYIKAQVYGRYNIVIKDRGERIYAQVRRKEEQDRDQLIQVSIPDQWGPYSGTVFDPIEEAPDGSRTILIKKKATPAGTWFVDELHPVRQFLEKETDIPTSNRSTYVVMQDLFQKCPRGPWFVTGRGNTLLIHNRDLGRNIYREYRYMDEPGYLIDFTAKTKFENFEKQVISYAGMDPKDRRNFFIDDYRKALETLRDPKVILEDREISDEDKEKELREYFNLRQVPYSKFGVTEVEGAYFNVGTPQERFYPGEFGKEYTNKEPYPLTAVPDNSNIVNPDPMLRQDKGGFDKYKHDVILRATWYTIPLLSYEEAVNVTNNRQRKLAMDKEEGKMILEGDPWLKSEITVRITNVYSQHEGHYYIKKCEHIITNQGFKTQLDCLKVVPEAKITSLGTITKDEYNIADEDLRELIQKQYKREQLLFGPDVKITYRVEGRIIQQGGPEKESAIVQDVYETVSYRKLRYENGYSDDQAIEILMNLAQDPSAMIDFSPQRK